MYLLSIYIANFGLYIEKDDIFYVCHIFCSQMRVQDDFSLKGLGLWELKPVNKQSSDWVWVTNSWKIFLKTKKDQKKNHLHIIDGVRDVDSLFASLSPQLINIELSLLKNCHLLIIIVSPSTLNCVTWAGISELIRKLGVLTLKYSFKNIEKILQWLWPELMNITHCWHLEDNIK